MTVLPRSFAKGLNQWRSTRKRAYIVAITGNWKLHHRVERFYLSPSPRLVNDGGAFNSLVLENLRRRLFNYPRHPARPFALAHLFTLSLMGTFRGARIALVTSIPGRTRLHACSEDSFRPIGNAVSRVTCEIAIDIWGNRIAFDSTS